MRGIAGIFVLIAALLVSCGDKEAMRRLADADRVLDRHPDSALSIVRDIDTSALRTEEARARHSLLLTLSLLKTDPSSAGDSLFTPAWNYYGPLDTPSRETMLTHYTKDGLWFERDSIAHAIMEFDNAMVHAAGENRNLYIGLSLANQAALYANSGNPARGLECVERAFAHMRECDDTLKIIHLHLVAGMCNNGVDNHDDAEKEFLLASKLARESGNEEEESRLAMLLALTHEYKDEYDRALEEFERLAASSAIFDDRDMLAYIRSLLYSGRIDKARRLMEDLPLPSANERKVDYYFVLSEILAHDGDYRLAFAKKDSIIKYSNQYILESLNLKLEQKMYSMQSRLTETAVELARSERKGRIQSIIISVAVIVLVIVLSVLLFRRLRSRHASENRRRNKVEESLNMRIRELEDSRKYERKRNDIQQTQIEQLLSERTSFYKELHELDERMNTVQDMEEKKNALADEYAKIEKEMDSIVESISDLSGRISEKKEDMIRIFLEEHGKCASFCNNMPDIRGKVQLEGYEKDRERIIDDYRDEDYVSYLESRIDFLMDGMIAFLRNDLMMHDDMVRMLVYDICGFDYKSMALLFGITPQAAGVRRTRLRSRLEGAGDSRYDDLLRRYTRLLKRNRNS